MKHLVAGRQYVTKSIEKLEAGSFRAAMIETEKTVCCQRCGTISQKTQVSVPAGFFFCPACIRYGRITTKDYFTWIEPSVRSLRQVKVRWPGALTRFQQKISRCLVSNFEQQQDTLVWSVTGSGKTEMIFEVVAHALSQGGRVAIVSPRIDVCRELYPRIQEAFYEEDCLLMYGDSPEDYRYTDLLVATTHQLLHFYRNFELIIVDEVDAFPFEGDQMLDYGLDNALKKNGRKIYLSATPSNALLKKITPTFDIEKMPLRYHQRPLIVPETIWYEKWEQAYRSKRQLAKLIFYIRQLLANNFVLIFCPSIPYMKKLYQEVRPYFGESQVTSISAQDQEREEKVLAARHRSFQAVFTTTILERGVTFSNVSVIVMGANHPVFTKSALVQIAGRVDRKGEFNQGRVIFFYDQQKNGIRQAVEEIKAMNRLAKEWLKDEVQLVPRGNHP